MTAKITGVRAFNAESKRVMLDHRKAIQQSMATAMTKTRVRASKHIIPNDTSFANPYLARKNQPSTAGRLTSRTGKLAYMLKNRASLNNPLRHWRGFGKNIVKERSVALMGQIKAKAMTKTSLQFVGTYRVNIQSNARLFDTARGMPQESTRTLAVRFNWETGIRGSARPIFAPVASRGEFDMTKLVTEKNNRIWRLR